VPCLQGQRPSAVVSARIPTSRPVIRRSPGQEREDLRVAVRLLFDLAQHLTTCSWLEDHLSGAYPMHECDCGYEEARVAAVESDPSSAGSTGMRTPTTGNQPEPLSDEEIAWIASNWALSHSPVAPDINALLATIQRDRERIEALEGLLWEVEWAASTDYGDASCCPICNNYPENGHKATCKLRALLVSPVAPEVNKETQ
jgi:hypothetical protein